MFDGGNSDQLGVDPSSWARKDGLRMSVRYTLRFVAWNETWVPKAYQRKNSVALTRTKLAWWHDTSTNFYKAYNSW